MNCVKNEMSPDILLSIILPVYNSETTIEKCLQSICCQTYSNLQIIVIDDGSTDNSFEICRKIAASDSRIFVLHTINRGVSCARNTGLEHAIGEYVGFVDSDDWIEASMYQDMINATRNREADIVVQGLWFDFGENDRHKETSGKETVLSGHDALRELLYGRMFSGQLCNKIFRRKLLPLPFCDPHLMMYEDLYAVFGVVSDCSMVIYQDKACYHYTMHEQSAMHRKYDERIAGGKIVAKSIEGCIAGAHPDLLPYSQRLSLKINREILRIAYKSRKQNRAAFMSEYKNFQECAERCMNKSTRNIMTRSEWRKSSWDSRGRILFCIRELIHTPLAKIKHIVIG